MGYGTVHALSLGMTNALSTVSTDSLWLTAALAMGDADLSKCFSAVEELLVRAEKGDVCADFLACPSKTPLGEAYSAGQIQGLVDRVNSLNFLVRKGRR